MGYTSQQQVLDLLREPFFWKIFNANKEKRFSDLWNLFNTYNSRFSKYQKSKWHSEILNIAERCMVENDEWRFLDFFKEWNSENLMDDDWKEIKKGEQIYKPLALKCLKKAYEIAINLNNKESDLDWLVKAYSKAIKQFPNDEWLLRQCALLLIKNKQYDEAVALYKKLVLELGDKYYIWHEFSGCFHSDRETRLSMLSKAMQLERNEDFLGDIHLELAQILLDSNLIENSIVELQLYKKHRELKGWKLSESYGNILKKIVNVHTQLKDNKELYAKYTPLAEQFAYADIEWTKMVLADRWKDDKNKERYKFSNGKEVEFTSGSAKFRSLAKADVGNIVEFKLHKKQKEGTTSGSLYLRNRVIEYIFTPLIVRKTKEPNWSILEDEYAVIDYINNEKGVIHLISASNVEIYLKDNVHKYKVNDIIKGKRFTTKRNDGLRVELKEIEKVDKQKGLSRFSKRNAVIDSVNTDKELFHFVVNSSIHGIIKFSETNIIPKEGSLIEIHYVSKVDKKTFKTIYKPIEIKETAVTDPNLLRTIVGELELKYKRDECTLDYWDLTEKEILELSPDFGFIGDLYVPKRILEETNLNANCTIKAKVVNTGLKWKIAGIEKIWNKNIYELVSLNDYFLLRLICIHHPLSTDDIIKYGKILKWGTGIYTYNNGYEHGYDHRIDIATYGLCFNKYILWNSELASFVKSIETELANGDFLFDNDPVSRLFQNFPLSIEKEFEIRKEKTSSVYLAHLPDQKSPEEEVAKYFELHESLLKEYSEILTLQFNFSTIEELVGFITNCRDSYSLNSSLYYNFMAILKNNNIDVVTILKNVLEKNKLKLGAY